MGGPGTWVGLWEPNGDDESLVRACAGSLARAGASVEYTWRGDDFIALCRGARGWALDRTEEILVEPARSVPGAGGLVQLVADTYLFYETPGIKPAAAWAKFRDAVVRLAAEVRPLIASCIEEFPVDDLADPPDDVAEFLFLTCWVDPTRLSAPRRQALDAASRELRTEAGDGWWWSIFEPMDFGRHEIPDDWRRVTKELWSAWTGKEPTTPAEEDLPIRAVPAPAQLRFWAADRDDEPLRGEVAGWAKDRELAGEVEIQPWREPGWAPIQLSLEGVEEPDQLHLLRSAAAAVAPSWVAITAAYGEVPGYDPDIPAMGRLENVWVRNDWIGADRQARLDEALRGAHREEHAGGMLYVTSPSLVPGEELAAWCYVDDERYDRQVEAAGILAEAAVASRKHPWADG